MHTVIGGGGVELAVDERGEGTPVVLLHGVTATRDYVVMGSGVLPASGAWVVSYDARGHGQSSPAPRADGYGYGDLVEDLLAVLDALALTRPVIAGASIGAGTALALALSHPDRVAGVVAITPSYDPDEATLAAQRAGGIAGYLDAYGRRFVTGPWREPVLGELESRMQRHDSPAAVADALDQVAVSRPFADLDGLAAVGVPALVIASRDEPDPMHPLAVAARYARALPRAELIVEDEGQVPVAWQGGRLSRILARFVSQVASADH
jgi:pimeloyl-ACP methyl ester carboxylesterase